MKFTIAIEVGTEEAAYGIAVPDLPGCFSAGDTVEEAFENAREAIEASCEMLAEERRPMPQPKEMSEWMADPEYRGWNWGLIDVPIERYFGPAEKINITVPAGVLKQIDSFAAAHGESRSGFLTKAALEAMRRAG